MVCDDMHHHSDSNPQVASADSGHSSVGPHDHAYSPPGELSDQVHQDDYHHIGAHDQPSSDDHHDHGMYVFGNPVGDGFTHQTTGYTCAVVSQKMVLDQFGVVDPATAQPVSEAHLVHLADSHGWLSDHGTSVNDMGKLLNYFGVSTHSGNGWQQLLDDLKQGRHAIIPVNADNLWSHQSPLFQSLDRHPNHALVIKGVKIDDDGHIDVVVNDPGQAHGAGVRYSLAHFRAALEDKHFHFVATDHMPTRIGQTNVHTASPDPIDFNLDTRTPIIDALTDFARHSTAYSIVKRLRELGS